MSELSYHKKYLKYKKKYLDLKEKLGGYGFRQEPMIINFKRIPTESHPLEYKLGYY